MSLEPPLLAIEVTDVEDACTVVLAGEIDLSTATQLSRALEDVVTRPRPPATVEVSLIEVSFMDSMGLAILLRALHDAEAVGSRLTVISMSPVIARLFEMSGVTAVLTHGR